MATATPCKTTIIIWCCTTINFEKRNKKNSSMSRHCVCVSSSSSLSQSLSSSSSSQFCVCVCISICVKWCLNIFLFRTTFYALQFSQRWVTLLTYTKSQALVRQHSLCSALSSLIASPLPLLTECKAAQKKTLNFIAPHFLV